MDVRFTLPANYPDEIPEITITMGTGVEAGEMRDLERVLTQQVSGYMKQEILWGFLFHLKRRLREKVSDSVGLISA